MGGQRPRCGVAIVTSLSATGRTLPPQNRPAASRPNALRPSEAAARASDAMFCDLIADGMSIAEAGRAVGITKTPAHRKWRRICAEMGEKP